VKFRFHRRHFVTTVALFGVLLYIALFVRDDFVRPYVGDVLVVPFMFHALATVLDVTPRRLVFGVWVFAFAVECAQYGQLVARLGLADNRLASTVIGTSFSVEDLIAYSVGALLTLWASKYIERKPEHRASPVGD
jgi:hypothetical protein